MHNSGTVVLGEFYVSFFAEEFVLFLVVLGHNTYGYIC